MRGILVGCDAAQEWLLSWWWENYRQENILPVAFADFGLSAKGKKWCLEKGILLSIPTEQLKVATRIEIDPNLAKEWDQTESPFWDIRGAWFKKPLSFLYSPFQQSIWLDLDCEILGRLEPIFQFIHPQTKMGLVCVEEKDIPIYNTGVVVFEKDSPLLNEWIEHALHQNHRFLGDQDALSSLIFEKKYPVGPLPEIYNWLMCKQLNPAAVVLHWAAKWGKKYIQEYGGLRHELKNCLPRMTQRPDLFIDFI